MKWTEKVWIVMDQLQLFALLWLTECADADRRFPFIWCTKTMWSPYVNADLNAIWSFEFNALNSTVSLNDEPNKKILNGSPMLWVLFSAPAVLILAYVGYFLLLQRKLKQGLRLNAWIVPIFERCFLYFLYYAYLPWQLVVSRYALCIEMQALQNWQMLYTCESLTNFQHLCRARKNCNLDFSTNDQAMFAIASVLVLLYSFGLPILLWLHIRRGLIFEGWRQHERWLRAVETEYMLEASGYWSHHHYPLHSSVFRPWAGLLPISLMEKLAIVWLLAATNPVSNGVVIRDSLVLVILALHLAALCYWPSFRLDSSRLMAQVLVGGNLVTAGVRALMSAGFTSNVFLVLGLLLPAHHGVAALACLAGVVYYAAAGERWPVNAGEVRRLDAAVMRMTVARGLSGVWAGYDSLMPQASDGGQAADGEAVPSESAAHMAPAHRGSEARTGLVMEAAALHPVMQAAVMQAAAGGAVAAVPGWAGAAPRAWDGVAGLLEAARAGLLEEQLRTEGFFRVGLTRGRIVVLEGLLAAARRAGHGLEHAVEDALSDAVAAHNAAVAAFRRAYPLCRWDSFADHPRLGPLLPAWRTVLDRRDHVLLLLPRRTRRLLARLAALRAFVGLRVEVARKRSVRRRARLEGGPSGGRGGAENAGGGTEDGKGRRRRGEARSAGALG